MIERKFLSTARIGHIEDDFVTNRRTMLVEHTNICGALWRYSMWRLGPGRYCRGVVLGARMITEQAMLSAYPLDELGRIPLLSLGMRHET